MKNKELRQKSRADLKNKYGFALLTMILLNLVSFGAMTVGLFFGAIFTAGAVQCCFKAFYIDVANRKLTGVDSVYRGFRQFMRALIANILLTLIYFAIFFVIGLIMLVIIKAAESAGFAVLALGFLVILVLVFIFSVKFSFVFFIMNDDVNLSGTGCIKRSWALTKGRFWKILGMKLSFIGWWLLVLITFGALYLYVAPYAATAEANLYLDSTKGMYPSSQSTEA